MTEIKNTHNVVNALQVLERGRIVFVSTAMALKSELLQR
jgi:hypothetical protein